MCAHSRTYSTKGIDAMPEEPLAAGVGAHEPELEAFQPGAERGVAGWRCRHR